MRLSSLLLTFAPVALLFTACGEEDEGSAFKETTNGEVGASGEADTINMTGPDMAAESSSTETSTGTDTGTTTTGTDTGTTTGTTTTTGGGMCGDGAVQMGEQCDGGNLNGFSCVDLGFSGGTLACDPVTCTYDSSNCTTNPGTTG